jgi:hypothetical protein
MNAPPLGSFIRPVGHFAYCLELVLVFPEDGDGPEQWHLKRWGLDANKQPINDGRSNGLSYISNLKQIAKDVWKDEWEFKTPRWGCCPLYYRLMQRKNEQLGLF